MAHVQSNPLLIGGTGTQSLQIPVPPEALALVAVTWNGTGAFTRHTDISVESDFARVLRFFAFRGRKSSHGVFPVVQTTRLLIGITVATADAALAYDLIASFLMPDLGDSDVPLPAIPFKALGGDDVTVDTDNASAANTAQTVDIDPLNEAGLEVLSAWFYASAGTATGEMDFFDGTTAVTIDSTAAVAEYTFNMQAKGNPFIVRAVDAGNVARFVIGAAGAGNTTTLKVVYRAFPYQ